jgi:hypothetical protein
MERGPDGRFLPKHGGGDGGASNGGAPPEPPRDVELELIEAAFRQNQPPEIFERIRAETDKLFVEATVEQVNAYRERRRVHVERLAEMVCAGADTAAFQKEATAFHYH